MLGESSTAASGANGCPKHRGAAPARSPASPRRKGELFVSSALNELKTESGGWRLKEWRNYYENILHHMIGKSMRFETNRRPSAHAPQRQWRMVGNAWRCLISRHWRKPVCQPGGRYDSGNPGPGRHATGNHRGSPSRDRAVKRAFCTRAPANLSVALPQ
jgi:hypothetical protein